MAPTTDLSNIATTLADLEMVSYSPTGPQQLGSTYMAAAIEDLKTVLDLRGDHGDGSTPKKRRSFVVVAGDGLDAPSNHATLRSGNLRNLEDGRPYRLRRADRIHHNARNA